MKPFIKPDTNCEKCLTDPTDDICVRDTFFKKCIPILSMYGSEVNIINFTEDGYIHYAGPPDEYPEYIVGQDFTLKIKPKTKTKKASSASVPLIAPPAANALLMFEKKIGNYLRIDDLKVPIYYMFCAHHPVLDFFCFFANKRGFGKAIVETVNSLVKSDDKHKFIGFSFMFNILNVGLLCDKFFDIYPLLVAGKPIPPNEKGIAPKKTIGTGTSKIDEGLVEKIKGIFSAYNLDNLYVIFGKYYTGIQRIKKNEELMKGKYGVVPKTHESDPLTKQIQNFEVMEKHLREKGIGDETIGHIFNIKDRQVFDKIFELNDFSKISKDVEAIDQDLMGYEKQILDYALQLATITEKIKDKDIEAGRKEWLEKRKQDLETTLHKNLRDASIYNKFSEASVTTIDTLLKFAILSEKRDKLIKSKTIQPELIKTILGMDTNTQEMLTLSIPIPNVWEILAEQIVHLNTILREIAHYVPDFPNLFMMVYLARRLKEKYIKGTWGFCNKSIEMFLGSNIEQIPDDIEKNGELGKISKYYKKIEPVLYEYQEVTFEGITYPNCMENTLLQLIKVLFWNNTETEKKYNIALVDKLIKDPEKKKIKKFLKDLNESKERSLTFANEWTVYVVTHFRTYLMDGVRNPELKPMTTYLEKLKKSNKNYEKIFMRITDNSIKDARELNATLYNLMLFVLLIFNVDTSILKKDELIDETTTKILNNILSKILEGYTVVVKTVPSLEGGSAQDDITLNIYNKYEIKLGHAKHAFFIGSLLSEGNENIIVNIYTHNEKFLDDTLVLPDKEFPKIFMNESSIRWILYKHLDAYLCTNIEILNDDIIVRYIEEIIPPINRARYFNLLFNDGVKIYVHMAELIKTYKINRKILCTWLKNQQIISYFIRNNTQSHHSTIIDDQDPLTFYMNAVGNLGEESNIILKNFVFAWIKLSITQIKSEKFWDIIADAFTFKENIDLLKKIVDGKTIVNGEEIVNWKFTAEIESPTFWTHVIGTEVVAQKIIDDTENLVFNNRKFPLCDNLNITSSDSQKFLVKFTNTLVVALTSQNVERIVDNYQLWDCITTSSNETFWTKFSSFEWAEGTKSKLGIGTGNNYIEYWPAISRIKSEAFWKVYVEMDWNVNNFIDWVISREQLLSPLVMLNNKIFFTKFLEVTEKENLKVFFRHIIDPEDDNYYWGNAHLEKNIDTVVSDIFWKSFIDNVDFDEENIDVMMNAERWKKCTVKITSDIFWSKIISSQANKIEKILINWDGTVNIQNGIFWSWFVNYKGKDNNTDTKLLSMKNEKILKNWSDTIKIKNDVFWTDFVKNINKHLVMIIEKWSNTVEIKNDVFWKGFNEAATITWDINLIDNLISKNANTLIHNDEFWKKFFTVDGAVEKMVTKTDTWGGWEAIIDVENECFWTALVSALDKNKQPIKPNIIKTDKRGRWEGIIDAENEYFWTALISAPGKNKQPIKPDIINTNKIHSEVFKKWLLGQNKSTTRPGMKGGDAYYRRYMRNKRKYTQLCSKIFI